MEKVKKQKAVPSHSCQANKQTNPITIEKHMAVGFASDLL
jgi:hypothetical protein